MKLSYLSLIIASVGIASCSTQRKAQTTDDVYYSSGQGGYVATDGSDDRVASNAQTTDNYNNYAYGNDGYAPFSTFSYGMGYGMGFGYGFGYSPWASPF
jgi:hypothetical protein